MSSDNSYGQLFGDIFGCDANSSYILAHDGHFFRYLEPPRDGFLLRGFDSHLSSLVHSHMVSASSFFFLQLSHSTL